jgi:myo-inositol-1(or 4)-monophosphatase
MSYKKEYEFAKQLAVEVGDFAAEQQFKDIRVKEKQERDLCTEIDLESEKRIIEAIKEQFPKDTILAEETQTEISKQSGRVWIIDPIDGTAQFAMGEDNYSIIIALVDKGTVQIGIVYQPVTKRLYHALRNDGAYCNKKTIQPKKEQDLNKLLVIKGLWFDRAADKLDNGLRMLKKVMENCLDERRYGSCGLDCCRVSSGKAGAYYEFNLNPWDVAGPSLIVQESGAIITKVDGSTLDIFNKENGEWNISFLVSANETIHKKMLDILKEE